jgi:hypothetical protein
VFCIYLRTNSDLCHLQHKLTGFYNPDEKCLQRGTNWVFKYSGLRLVCKGVNQIHTLVATSFRAVCFQYKQQSILISYKEITGILCQKTHKKCTDILLIFDKRCHNSKCVIFGFIVTETFADAVLTGIV